MLAAYKVRKLLAKHGEVRSQPETDWSGPFRLPREIEQYYREVGPDEVNIELPWNPCSLPRLADLWSFQEGYRWNGMSGERIEDWLDAWLVVASLGGDPFIFHRHTGVILHDFHGSGTWKPQFLFDDVNSMAACLAALGSIWTEAGRGLWDEEWRMFPKYRALAIDQIGELLSSKLNATRVLDRLDWR